MEQEFSQIWQRLEADRKAGRARRRRQGQGRGDAEGRLPRHRRAAGAAGPAAGRDRPREQHRGGAGRDDPGDAMEARRYPGPGAAGHGVLPPEPAAQPRALRAPIYEEKVVDFVLELAKVEDTTVTPEELAKEPPTPEEGSPRAEAGQAEARAEPAAGQLASWSPAPDSAYLCRTSLGPEGDGHDGSRSGRDLRQHAGADGGRADRPRRARLRHLFAPAEGADHLPDRAGPRRRSQR